MAERQTTTKNQSEALLPPGAWDTHHHIFEPKRIPYAQERHLTPPAATIAQYNEFKSKLGISKSVLTHGLSYGDDCTSLKLFVPELGRDVTAGVAVIDPENPDATALKKLRNAGVRGIRVNLYKYKAMHDVDLQMVALRDHAQVIRKHDLGWSMAFTHVHPEFWRELKPVVHEITNAGIPLITDHFALLKGSSMVPEQYRSDVTKQPGFQDIIDLVISGSLYIKISAPYRVSEEAPAYNDLRPIVTALVEANPRRVIWGSDWPHTPRMKVRSHEEALQESPFLEVDDAAWLKSLKSWLTEEQWQLVMVENPRTLYA